MALGYTICIYSVVLQEELSKKLNPIKIAENAVLMLKTIGSELGS